MARDLGLDEVVDHFTLNGEESGWLRNKTGATRLGFAVQMKFLLWRGRFPRMRLELPRDAVEHVARQVGVDSGDLAGYDFTSRTAQRHRTELRELTGWHECTRTDMVKLVSWLVDEIWHDERREESIRVELLKQMRVDLIEPPTPDQVTTIVRSALHQAEERAVDEVATRLARVEGCTRRLDALAHTDVVGDQDGEAGEEDVEAVLSRIKAHPGNVSLNSRWTRSPSFDRSAPWPCPPTPSPGSVRRSSTPGGPERRRPRPATCDASALRYGTSCSPRWSSAASGRSPTPWWSC